jgi:hypothetical protein
MSYELWARAISYELEFGIDEVANIDFGAMARDSLYTSSSCYLLFHQQAKTGALDRSSKFWVLFLVLASS